MKYPNLFRPIRLGNTLFRNRIFASPQGFYNIGPDCLPNPEAAAYYERKAIGGFASICVGDCIVDRSGAAITAFCSISRIPIPSRAFPPWPAGWPGMAASPPVS